MFYTGGCSRRSRTASSLLCISPLLSWWWWKKQNIQNKYMFLL
jgi:hypothetical protein